MGTAVAIRHIHFEDLGTLEPLLRENGFDVHYIDPAVENLAEIDPMKPDLLVFLGGPIGAFDDELYPFVVDETRLMRQRLAAKLPVLGICLGAQMMARAMGANVYAMTAKEIGFTRLDLAPRGGQNVLSGIGNTPVLHWHGDQFDIPEGAVHLAATDRCPNQAFSVGNYALALQFHVEADTAMIERWLVGHASELAQAGADVRALRSDARRCGDALKAASREMMVRWLRLSGLVS
ncbi:glutamine amidotransferase class-I [Paraburkholderia caribensis MBA4]|uniref:Glutamine amidotransferase class-I n=1 Tax=Paraburkholderia caribensis MBA4 TaxID=1323664 RepID=A0A0P0RIC5_9BURK|nr:glutamine amidotransferase [Paraburkholderia caribensis]ALL68321.1 glutamine amidotransferase class-I [Paraburkholderia caribensis MBA4]